VSLLAIGAPMRAIARSISAAKRTRIVLISDRMVEELLCVALGDTVAR
jgi:hypothetical protein